MRNLKYIKEFKEYPIHNHDDMITEMARINDKKEFPYDVFVYGGPSYCAGRTEHGVPHFHFADNIKNPNKIDISIKIPTIKEWELNKELIITEDKDEIYDWCGRKKFKEEIVEWLDKSNKNIKTITNLEMIIIQWNMLNSDNKNVKQIPVE